jgi:hypothetical protein
MARHLKSGGCVREELLREDKARPLVFRLEELETRVVPDCVTALSNAALHTPGQGHTGLAIAESHC